MMEKIDFQMFIQNEKTIVILDNCTILDLYRYSPEVSKSLLNVFNSVKSKLWLPQQVYDEFSENKESVFSEQFNQFKNIASVLFQQQNNLEQQNQQLSSLRDWLLPMLMNGQVKV